MGPRLSKVNGAVIFETHVAGDYVGEGIEGGEELPLTLDFAAVALSQAVLDVRLEGHCLTRGDRAAAPNSALRTAVDQTGATVS